MLANSRDKLLIPNEIYKNEKQKKYEIENFTNSRISAKQWRKKNVIEM